MMKTHGSTRAARAIDGRRARVYGGAFSEERDESMMASAGWRGAAFPPQGGVHAGTFAGRPPDRVRGAFRGR